MRDWQEMLEDLAFKQINPEVDQYVMSLFNQSFVLILMIIIALAAFLFFDYSTITVEYNKQLIGN